MLSNPRRRHRRIRRTELEEDENEEDNANASANANANADNHQQVERERESDNHQQVETERERDTETEPQQVQRERERDTETEPQQVERERGRETELDRELESIIRRRRRSSAAILQLLQGIRAGIMSEQGNLEGAEQQAGDRDRDRNNERERGERVILINPFNQTIIVQGSYDPSFESQNRVTPIGALGDYFIGPGLDLLLQHLSENDPNRYGTPPAQKEAVEALPNVKVEESLQCAVCLDECEIGTEVKEMPCKHKFHGDCILPWLELHSSCPICRYQLPCDESKLEAERNNNGNNSSSSNNNSSSSNNNGADESGRHIPLPWPFSSLFSISTSRPGSGNSPMVAASTSESSSAENALEASPSRATLREEEEEEEQLPPEPQQRQEEENERPEN